ncbi:MAG: hypothetical protein KDA80_01595 [Planctomycetaceae bacterium]|nr:hypothetical protein [Planctomycetaceae bacterium]
MDKLQPIIQNRFWILAGLVLPLSMYGYYSANGALKEQTESRESELSTTKSGVSQGFEPNEDYQKKLAFINGHYEVAVNQAIVELWQHQQERMTWPAVVASGIPSEFMGEIPVDKRFPYINSYELLIEELRRRFEPVAPKDKQDIAAWKQKVVLAASLPQAEMRKSGITSQEMWDAQIDIWLVRLLADSVVKINEDKDSVTEAVLRRIDRLELYGGDGKPVLGGSKSGSGDSMMGGSEMMEMYSSAPGGGGASAGVSSSVSFDPGQVFGAGGGTPSAGGSFGESSSMMMMSSMMGGGDGDSAPVATLRYIDETEDAPYLERGFYMSVIIMQKKIPDFVVELANSDWPVRVERFHIGENPHRKEIPIGRSPRGFGGFGSEGMDYQDYDMESRGSMGMEGYGQGRGRGGAGSVNPYATGLPEFADAAMNHPDLVQLDLAGIITMYREPTAAREALASAQQEIQAASDASAAREPLSPTGNDLIDSVSDATGQDEQPSVSDIPSTAADSTVPPLTAEEEAAVPPANAVESVEEPSVAPADGNETPPALANETSDQTTDAVQP